MIVGQKRNEEREGSFGSKPGMVETIRRTALAGAAIAIISCSGGGSQQESSTGGSGTVQTGGQGSTTSSTGGQSSTTNGSGGNSSVGTGGATGTAGSTASLCDQYPDGSPNRIRFNLGDVKNPDQSTTMDMFFKLLVQSTTDPSQMIADFETFPSTLSSSPNLFALITMTPTTTTVQSIGSMTFEMCSSSSAACSIASPGLTNSITGDSSCYAVVAASLPFTQ